MERRRDLPVKSLLSARKAVGNVFFEGVPVIVFSNENPFPFVLFDGRIVKNGDAVFVGKVGKTEGSDGVIFGFKGNFGESRVERLADIGFEITVKDNKETINLGLVQKEIGGEHFLFESGYHLLLAVRTGKVGPLGTGGVTRANEF